MKIINSKEVESWLFQHAQIQGHVCDGVKGVIEGDTVNIAYVDRSTGEKIDVEYEPDEVALVSDQQISTTKTNKPSAITVNPGFIVYSVSIPIVALNNMEVVFHEVFFDEPPSRESVMEVIMTTTDFSDNASSDSCAITSERILRSIDQVPDWVMLLDGKEWIAHTPISLQLMEDTTAKAHSYIVTPPFTWVKRLVFSTK